MSTLSGGEMRRIPMFVVLPPDTLMLDVAGPMEVFRRANLEQAAVQFDYVYVAAAPEQTTSIGLTVSGLMALPENLPDNAWIVISGSLTAPEVRERNRDALARIVRWLSQSFRPGMTLVTICSGALLAGEAGLFDGFRCTTHAACMAELTARAPLSQPLDNRLFVEDRDRLSSAGISTGIDLALHIVSQLISPATALAIARQMVVYMRRSGSDPQLSPWLTGRNHVHPGIHRAQDAIMAEPAAEWSLARLGRIAHLSERHLSRLFREHAGMAATDYVNMIRVNLAAEMLSGSDLAVEDIAARTGFSSARHMRRVWNGFHTEPPARFRSRAGGL
ncbi:GlxA family transcriptional regulator [Rhizobium sp. C4]|uniref:GlxA family transcriptional regulator n=1 Tax=Rhizobium sp. C4 TaxID=1349800 RepID=UPI001E45CF26|nr:helix-turn-helix domain-containing protein [Rhizobium sp. C4]MCD2174465.1 helix-turn-helix domain-containing protein [Rhizobium sp. C4]